MQTCFNSSFLVQKTDDSFLGMVINVAANYLEAFLAGWQFLLVLVSFMLNEDSMSCQVQFTILISCATYFALSRNIFSI